LTPFAVDRIDDHSDRLHKRCRETVGIEQAETRQAGAGRTKAGSPATVVS